MTNEILTITLNQDSLLDDPVERIGDRIASRLWAVYSKDQSVLDKVTVVASPKFHGWIVEHWPYYYLSGIEYKSSKLKWLFDLLRLPDYLEKKVRYIPCAEAAEAMRQDIRDNEKLICFGVYFHLLRAD